MWRLTAERELMSMLSTSLADQVSRTLQTSGTTTTWWVEESKKRKGDEMWEKGKRRGKDIVPVVTICWSVMGKMWKRGMEIYPWGFSYCTDIFTSSAQMIHKIDKRGFLSFNFLSSFLYHKTLQTLAVQIYRVFSYWLLSKQTLVWRAFRYFFTVSGRWVPAVFQCIPCHNTPVKTKALLSPCPRWETEAKRRNTVPIHRNAYLLSLCFLPALSFKSRNPVNIVLGLNH